MEILIILAVRMIQPFQRFWLINWLKERGQLPTALRFLMLAIILWPPL